MRFCPWYPLADAAAHAPSGRGVIQVRIAEGLLDYPTGKSAMVHYELTDDVRAAALAFAARGASGAEAPQSDHGLARAQLAHKLLCRHTVEMTAADDLGTFHARLLRDFRARFGATPAGRTP